jgi:hypothetical protein
MITPQNAGLQGRGRGIPLFSSPFVCLSFAPAPSFFALLKTIVRPGRVILCNHRFGTGAVKAGNRESPVAGRFVVSHPCDGKQAQGWSTWQREGHQLSPALSGLDSIRAASIMESKLSL